MIHGPCGNDLFANKCYIDNKCSKEFPKAFKEETVYIENHFPLY